MYKNTPIILSIILIAVIGFIFIRQAEPEPVIVIAPLNEKAIVEGYVRANIKDVATDKAVLGGTWYVVSIDVDEVANQGQVVYEDGHIQSTGVFDYKFDSVTGAVTIEKFTVVKPATIPATSFRGIIIGRITLSPICPIERDPPDPNCAPKDYKTNVTARKNGQVVTSTTSDENGQYKFTLAPGEYQIEPTGGQIIPSCNAETAVVSVSSTTTLDLSCDTGIR